MTERKTFIINFLYFTIIIGCMLLFGRYVLPVIMPFVVAFIMAYFLRKPIERFSLNGTANKKIISIIVLILFYIFIASACLILGTLVYTLAHSLIVQIPNFYVTNLEPLIDDFYLFVSDLNKELSPEVRETVLTLLETTASEVKMLLINTSNYLIKGFTNIITKIPGLLITFILTIVSSFFIVIDYDRIIAYGTSLMSDDVRKMVQDGHRFLKDKLFVVILSYLKIILLTFIELMIGLHLLNVQNAVIIAAIIAIFDIMPVLGTGGIIIPWAIISLCYGDTLLGIGLLMLYVAITVIRNIVEPKLVGTELGLHPVATLAIMLIGAKFFGVIGLFGAPIFLSFVLYELEKQKDTQTEKIKSAK